jgi:hypothetical protein
MPKMKKILASVLVISHQLALANCAIPGWPGCSMEDFNNALRAEQQQNLMEQQVRELQRNNQLLREQNQLLEQIQMAPPAMSYDQQRMQRCLTMPLRTPGC